MQTLLQAIFVSVETLLGIEVGGSLQNLLPFLSQGLDPPHGLKSFPSASSSSLSQMLPLPQKPLASNPRPVSLLEGLEFLRIGLFCQLCGKGEKTVCDPAAGERELKCPGIAPRVACSGASSSLVPAAAQCRAHTWDKISALPLSCCLT
jgi:hypothetical protein